MPTIALRIRFEYCEEHCSYLGLLYLWQFYPLFLSLIISSSMLPFIPSIPSIPPSIPPSTPLSTSPSILSSFPPSCHPFHSPSFLLSFPPSPSLPLLPFNLFALSPSRSLPVTFPRRFQRYSWSHLCGRHNVCSIVSPHTAHQQQQNIWWCNTRTRTENGTTENRWDLSILDANTLYSHLIDGEEIR